MGRRPRSRGERPARQANQRPEGGRRMTELAQGHLIDALAGISPDDAEEYTQALGQIAGGTWRQIAWAERIGIPAALGLSTRDWVEQRLGGYVRVSISDRRDAVAELTAPEEDAGQGRANVEAADVLGISEPTVRRDRRSSNDEPEPEPESEPQVPAPPELVWSSNDEPEPEPESEPPAPP